MILIGVGSSIGNAEEIFSKAETTLNKACVKIVQKSKKLKNPPTGGIAKNEFTNAVWEIAPPKGMTPHELLNVLKSVEKEAGRNMQAQRWSDRVLDLDILIFHDQVLETPTLTIPHPRIGERDFVLLPMGELVDENYQIPNLGTLKSLLKK